MKRLLIPRRVQQGVVLVLTLIVLVALTLAGLALMRSVDTSTLIAGNLAFKQSATISADAGVEAALQWLGRNRGNLNSDIAASGYYATSQDALDLTGNATTATNDNLNWNNNSAVERLDTDQVGNQVSYVIHRMCNTAGNINATTCATESMTMDGKSLGSSRQMLTYQPGSWDDAANRVFYRITVRVDGPRSNVSFVQAVILQ
ncbi:pilus assembly PilX family protein [Pseudoduganella sp. OTU4001]|uniref:pilus assembly PilX family protein n=1 Tax=Pseudoduganella sp. OTU4001 TaxID=3043854 RepID=UPI00313E4567